MKVGNHHAIPFLLFATCRGALLRSTGNLSESTFFVNDTISSMEVSNGDYSVQRLLQQGGGQGEEEDDGDSSPVDICANWITSGDAESGSVSDWTAMGNPFQASLDGHSRGPPGSSTSYRYFRHYWVNSGPGQNIDIGCLEVGKQYKISAQLRVLNSVRRSPYGCSPHAEWLDPAYCPIFTISAVTEGGQTSRLNLGNQGSSGGHAEWQVDDWNRYNAVFTVDERLASASDAYIYIRGTKTEAVLYFDDVSVVEYVGEDTRLNFWTTEATSNDESNSLPDVTYEYQYYDGDNYESGDGSSCREMVVDGDAATADLSNWQSLGSEGGGINLHNRGPSGTSKSFMHSDRPFFNTGPGQTNLDLSCITVGERYEIKAKIKLIDDNGFAKPCDRDSHPNTEMSCPIFTFQNMETEEMVLDVHSDIGRDWEPQAFNEFHGVFTATSDFANDSSIGWFIRGPVKGVNVVFNHISIAKYEGTDEEEVEEEEAPKGICHQLVTSGDADTGRIDDWEIKDIVTGKLLVHPRGPPGSNKSFKHVSREHISSGPGQDIDVSCLVEGKQYELSAMIKIQDQEYGNYACDKFAEWNDPDFCPLFTIWTNLPDEGIKRFNMGNDSVQHFVWYEERFNTYRAIFTVDERMASATEAYLYLRGPRINTLMMFDNISLTEVVAEDTRFNFWTGVFNPLQQRQDTGWNDPIEPEVPKKNDPPAEPLPPFSYKHYSDKYEVATGPCTQLVENGDAEPGDLDGWRIRGSNEAGRVVMHNFGPGDATKSFKAIDREASSSGPGQSFDPSCLELNKIYEVRAKIRLLDENGFPFQCTTLSMYKDGTCPAFTLIADTPTGYDKVITGRNDMKQVWRANEYNEFHFFFSVNEDIKNAVEPYWYFRGPKVGVTMLLDDVSIMKYENQLDDDENDPFEDAPDCNQLVVNGDAASGRTNRWSGVLGSGFMFIDSDVGAEGQSESFKFSARSSMNNGPSQDINVGCLTRGRHYEVNAKVYIEDGKSEAYACDPTQRFISTKIKPKMCIFMSLLVEQPWSTRKYKFYNEIVEPTIGWNDFKATVKLQTNQYSPSGAAIFFRGPPAESSLYLDDISMTLIKDDFVPTQITVPARDPSFECDEYKFCCEMVKNSDSEFGNALDWFPVGFAGGTIVSHNGGADGSAKAIRHEGRTDINSGPGQYFDSNCIVKDEYYEVKAKIKLLDADGNPFACDPGAEWNDPKFCPRFSFVIGTGWYDVHNFAVDGDGRKLSSETWNADGWNEYHGFFKPDKWFFVKLKTIYFMFRGPAAGIQIIVDDVSITPYQHEPDYEPVMPFPNAAFDFMMEADKVQIDGYNQTKCNIPVLNGDLESGNTDGWLVHNGGVLGVRRCSVGGGKFCLQHSMRTSKYMGPMQVLPVDCWQEGRAFEVFAKLHMKDQKNLQYGCDASAGIYSHCPLLTIRYKTDAGDQKWLYVANLDIAPWDKNIYNNFYGIFEITEEMASATEAHWYFERPPPGITILIDGVRMDEFILDADPEYKEMSKSCGNFVINGNAETGDTRGWTSRFGGQISIHDEGADMTQHSIKHSGRTSFIMGPKHDLMVNCLVNGMVYNFEAKIKLIDDETGYSFYCEREVLWGHDKSCPILTFQLEYEDGSTDWMYYKNHIKGLWDKRSWNYFQAPFQMEDKLRHATSGIFFFERPRAGVTILVDEVSIIRDCSVLIPNWNAEITEIPPWINYIDVNGKVKEGTVTTIPGGYRGSKYAFASTGRGRASDGPGHPLDVGCLAGGATYEFITYVALRDANGDLFECDKSKGWGDDLMCPIVKIVYYDGSTGKKDTFTLENDDNSRWDTDGFNRYHANFEVTGKLANANRAYFIFQGPPGGIDIIFDDTELQVLEDPGCSELIKGGDFESSVDTLGWSVEDSGEIDSFGQGFNSSNSIIVSQRTVTSDGPRVRLPFMCLLEGNNWVFTAYMKLVDEDQNPYKCDKSAEYGEPQACPTVVIEINHRHGFHQIYVNDIANDEWLIDDWNAYTGRFTVSNELANAESAFIKIKGPGPGVSIILDGVSTSRQFEADDHVDCSQLIKTTNAVGGLTAGWFNNGGGSIDVIAGGDSGNSKAFVHTGRTAIQFGPGQVLDRKCLEKDMKYEINAKFKLRDELGNFVGCDKSKPWKDENYCLIMTYVMTLPRVKSQVRDHIGNEYGGGWVRDEFNSFKSILTVTPDMAKAKEIYFYFQGPRAGVDIIFDNVSMKRVE